MNDNNNNKKVLNKNVLKHKCNKSYIITIFFKPIYGEVCIQYSSVNIPEIYNILYVI